MTTQPLVDTPALDLGTALALDLDAAPIFELDAVPIFDLDAGAGLDLGQKWPLEGLLNPAGQFLKTIEKGPETAPE